MFKTRYANDHVAAYTYCATWFTGDWSNWQIYHNKPGQANTNSNIESFNNVIKKSFTERRKLTIKSAIATLLKMCHHYSVNQRQFVMVAKYTRAVKAQADKLTKKNFKLVRRNQYTYQSLNTETKHTVTLNSPECHNMCYCSCKSFVKDAVCLHLVAISCLFNIDLFKGDYANEPEKFVQKTKKGKKRTKYGHALDKDLIESPQVETATTSKIAKKGKGRPRKIPIVEAPVEAQVEAPIKAPVKAMVVRRSSRIKPK